MDKISNGIEELGFGKWFLDSADPVDLESFDIARVIAVHKDSYILNNGENDVVAELIGRMRFSAASPVDFPAVGDWVLATFYDKGTFSIIHEVLPRKSLLKRKTPGKRIDFQLIAANIDVAFIVQSLDTNFNLRRLERYLARAQGKEEEAAKVEKRFQKAWSQADVTLTASRFMGETHTKLVATEAAAPRN